MMTMRRKTKKMTKNTKERMTMKKRKRKMMMTTMKM